jgi:hypothetical protein
MVFPDCFNTTECTQHSVPACHFLTLLRLSSIPPAQHGHAHGRSFRPFRHFQLCPRQMRGHKMLCWACAFCAHDCLHLQRCVSRHTPSPPFLGSRPTARTLTSHNFAHTKVYMYTLDMMYVNYSTYNLGRVLRERWSLSEVNVLADRFASSCLQLFGNPSRVEKLLNIVS